MRLIRLNTVVLPAPFGPIRVNTSPRWTSKLTLLTASTPPKRTVRFLADRRKSWLMVRLPQTVGLLEGLLPLEQALAVEREQLQVGAHLQPAAVQAERLEQHEGDQHRAVHD